MTLAGQYHSQHSNRQHNLPKEQKSQLMLNHTGSSLTGHREENQDALLVKVPEQQHDLAHKGIVACIADGVSCSQHSQKASHTAVIQFINDYYATPNSWSIKKSASKILTSLNTWLFEEGEKQGLAHNGLVTTFSCVVIKSNTAHLFHVGDTRIYLLRDGKLRQLTKDHQRVNFGKASYLTRALGMDSKLEVDYLALSLCQGDRFVLTCDGVHDFIEAKPLEQLCQGELEHNNTDLSRSICELALANGSQDNLSCLLLDITELPQHSMLEHQQRLLARVVPPAMQIGHVIDDFRVEKVLYQGSRSHVYQVIAQSSGTKMVLKAPSENYSEDQDYLVNFANEAWVGAQLSSPRVMKIYPAPEKSNFIYQLCEWIDGITLRQWMYDNPKPGLATVRNIIAELIKAVRVFQRADMVHRDLKPENILISPAGTVKVIDFGAVRVMGLEELQPESEDSLPLGAVNYIAPEYLAGNNATSLADLFSVAVIGYEMLTGQLPYKECTSYDLQAAKQISWQYRSMLHYRADLPPWLDLTFKKATHYLPTARYQAFSEFAFDLYTPNKALQSNFKASPIIERNPLLFWKITALVASTIAVAELVLLLQP